LVNGNENGAITIFSFSIKRTGKAEKKLSDLLLKMSELEDGILYLSVFGRGQKFNLFCASRNSETLRQFLKSEGLRARELDSFMHTASLRQVLRMAHKEVLSGMEIRTFDVFAFRTAEEEAAVYYAKNVPAQRKG
jgi:hypothetical protein